MDSLPLKLLLKLALFFFNFGHCLNCFRGYFVSTGVGSLGLHCWFAYLWGHSFTHIVLLTYWGISLSLSLSLSVVSRRGVVHLQHLCHSRGFGGCVVAVGLWVVAVVFALAWGLLGVAHATVADVRAGTYCKLTFLSSGGFDMWCFKFLFNLLNSLLTKPFSAV